MSKPQVQLIGATRAPVEPHDEGGWPEFTIALRYLVTSDSLPQCDAAAREFFEETDFPYDNGAEEPHGEGGRRDAGYTAEAADAHSSLGRKSNADAGEVTVSFTREEAKALLNAYTIEEFPISNPFGEQGGTILASAEAKLAVATHG